MLVNTQGCGVFCICQQVKVRATPPIVQCVAVMWVHAQKVNGLLVILFLPREGIITSIKLHSMTASPCSIENEHGPAHSTIITCIVVARPQTWLLYSGYNMALISGLCSKVPSEPAN